MRDAEKSLSAGDYPVRALAQAIQSQPQRQGLSYGGPLAIARPFSRARAVGGGYGDRSTDRAEECNPSVREPVQLMLEDLATPILQKNLSNGCTHWDARVLNLNSETVDAMIIHPRTRIALTLTRCLHRNLAAA
jgi:uncharacterized sporulation protein YeaH/YhbH (DUF444 family)